MKTAEQGVLLREIDEAVREDEMRSLWQRYGIATVAAVVIGLMAFGGYLWWDAQRSQAEAERGETPVHFGGERTDSTRHVLQRSQQFVARGGFLQIAEGAGIERGLHLVVAGKRGKNQNARRRIENPQRSGGVHATHPGELEVHEDNLRTQPPVARDDVFTSVCLANDLDRVVEFERRGEATSHDEVVVDDKHFQT